MHVCNKVEDILILVEGPRQELDDTILTAEAKYPINFTQYGKRFVLSLLYIGSNTFFLLILPKYINSKEKISKLKDYALCLCNVSKDFKIINVKKKTGLKRVV